MRVRPSTDDDEACRAAPVAPIVDAWQRRTSWAAAARTRRCTTWNGAGWWCSPGTGDVATVSWTSWPWPAIGLSLLYTRAGTRLPQNQRRPFRRRARRDPPARRLRTTDHRARLDYCR